MRRPLRRRARRRGTHRAGADRHPCKRSLHEPKDHLAFLARGDAHNHRVTQHRAPSNARITAKPRLTTYPGLPGPELTEHMTREAAEALFGPGVRFQIGRISMVANTGTYLD